MAVDTRAKRLSMMNFSDGCLLPDPSGTVDAPARATLLRLYSGITLVAAATGRAIGEARHTLLATR